MKPHENDLNLTPSSDSISPIASEPPSPPSPEAHPETLGRYRILGELGRGGMGVVYLGEDPDLEREVAIKVFPPNLSRSPESYKQFQREARLLAALNHPNVATIHSLEIIDGTPLLTMERIRGQTLAARLSEGALPIEKMLQVGAKIARAIEAAHERGVIHRDLKPGNVMIRDGDNEIKVLDFGLARSLRESLTSTPSAIPTSQNTPISVDPIAESVSDSFAPGTHTDPTIEWSDEGQSRSRASTPVSSIAGTIGYMSPEQIRGLPLDTRSDLFAFGCILFECATGAQTFAGIQETLKSAPQLDELSTDLSELARDLIGQCLAKDPADRPSSARAVRRIFEEDLERLRFRHRTRDLKQEGRIRSEEPPNNLPQALSSFVGRTEELRVVREMLESHRLVTLSGAGGAGKTRLAIEVARASLQLGASDGVWLVELAPLNDAGLLEKTAMTAMEIAEQADRTPLESVLEQLESRQALLVLDNCEHIVDAAAEFVDAVLERCPGVKVLVTSREPLGLGQEQRYAVPPLSARGLAEEVSAEELRESEAVLLFVERARQVQADFELTEANIEAVVGICRRLDGLPLALELAASRLRVIDPAALLERLDHRFRLLTGNSREKLPHHRTLAASLEWSHELLGESEQILYRRLGVFAGGFTLGAAEEVCVDEQLEAWRVLDTITSLIDKSLVEFDVQRKETGHQAPRYRMLETFRAYANDRLQEAGEGAAIHNNLVSYVEEMVRDEGNKLNGPDLKEALKRLDADYGNVREAIRIALTEIEDCQPALNITATLVRYWIRRSYRSEGIGFLERALGRPGAEARTPARARALNSSGTLEYLGGRYQPAIDHIKEAITVFHEHDMKTEIAFAQMGLGNTYSFLGRWEEALEEHKTVLCIARALDHRWLIGASLINTCNIQEALGDLDRVDEAAREAVTVLEEVGDHANLTMAHNYIAAVAYHREHWEEALDIYERGRVIASEHADRYSIGFQRMHAGLCRTMLGRYEEAMADYVVALEMAYEFDEPSLMASTLEACANHWHMQGMFAPAVVAFGLAAQTRTVRSLPLRDTNVEGVIDANNDLQTALGQERYQELEAEGRRMTVVDFIERAQAGTIS